MMKKKLVLAVVASLASVVLADGRATASRSFTFASWNIGHFALGLSHASTIPESAAEAKSREFRAFLAEVNADVLGVCEFSEAFATNGAVPSAKAVFAGYGQSVVGPCHFYQWNAQFLRAGTILGTRVHEYAKHAQGVYWLETRVKICGEEVVFVETHLDWCSPEVRSAQMRELVERFKDEPRVVLAGDFNQGIRYSDRSKPDADNPAEYKVFADAGFTLGNDGRHKTYPPLNPFKSLDNIIVKGLQLRNFKVWMRGDLSDHGLVSAELSF